MWELGVTVFDQPSFQTIGPTSNDGSTIGYRRRGEYNLAGELASGGKSLSAL